VTPAFVNQHVDEPRRQIVVQQEDGYRWGQRRLVVSKLRLLLLVEVDVRRYDAQHGTLVRDRDVAPRA
jgi:hypothetical protein